MKEFFKKIIVVVLSFEARMLLKRHKPKIVAITGSVGKTSTKDAIYAVLKQHMHARKSEKSFNSDIGVALTVLGLSNAWNNPFSWFRNIIDGALHAFFYRRYPEVLVLEMGVDRKGDMRRLTSWIKPDVVVITRLPDVPVHVEYFGSPEDVAEEKMILAYALKPEGVLIYNNDDQIIPRYINDIHQKSFKFGHNNHAHFTSSDDVVLYDKGKPIGMQFLLSHVGEKDEQVTVRGSLGVQHTYTYAAAAAVSSVFDISLHDAMEALANHVPPQGRMKIIEGVNGSVIIDDTYNSSPVACAHAVDTLLGLKVSGKRIAVLGDMLELGQYSVREHEKIGEMLSSKVDVLITLGLRAQKIAEGARAYGFDTKNIFQYDTAEAAIETLKSLIQNKDVILVKASQGIRAEKVVFSLMKEPEKAADLLVRQDPIWRKK